MTMPAYKICAYIAQIGPADMGWREVELKERDKAFRSKIMLIVQM